jgi:hypothetical protein
MSLIKWTWFSDFRFYYSLLGFGEFIVLLIMACLSVLVVADTCHDQRTENLIYLCYFVYKREKQTKYLILFALHR